MKCPKCQFENPETRKFCRECGAKLILTCPQCGAAILPGDKFCGECGHRLKENLETAKVLQGTEGERKQVTVLFSDLSGYTPMSERLDPEEVKEIMSQVFREVAQVVAKYSGFIEKFIGDAIMALFGVPDAHEDDPVRAIMVAREINDLVEAMNPKLEEKIGQPLSMHTGINTGLVVTGEVNLEMGTHGVTGDTINLASRLKSLAGAGEIIVGSETYRQAEGLFIFENLEPTKVKGKAEPVQIYKVTSPKKRPVKIHRLSGLRAELIGRKVELAQLENAFQRLQNGRGTILSICGDAGTGKSRLVEEFRNTLNLNEIQWMEGHAYPYSHNIPYFPLIDLFNKALQIEDGDSPERLRKKIEVGIQRLVKKNENVTPYIGSLYSLSYPEIKGVSPEYWKLQLKRAAQTIFSVLTKRASTVIYIEDIHWADPSSIDLFRYILLESPSSALFLCAYRPPFSLFASHHLDSLGEQYQEIQLRDLSPSESENMIESLLKIRVIPNELRRFIREKVEGNPFYLEEMINTLIDSGALTRDNDGWQLARLIDDSDAPSTVQGIISARLDRLEKETKRVLQEASVIGRTFYYEVLKRITSIKTHIDQYLDGLERVDLIRKRSLEPDLEYIFKHALTYEAVYNGLLKKERQEIHERIALVIEQLFGERISEFYEALAFHFEQGKSLHKAVHFLVKAGEKCLNRYAVEESHQYFKRAFELLSKKPDKTKEESELLIDLLIKWGFVYHYRGDFKGLKYLFTAHENLAIDLDNPARLGMYYSLIGQALYQTGKVKDSYQCLCKALKIGEEIEDLRVIGYACSALTWNCPDLGLMDEALRFGERAKEISTVLESEDYLYFNSLGGMGYAYWYKGDKKNTLETGKALLDFGRTHANIRSLVLGHFITGCAYLVDGNLLLATECFQSAIDASADPWFSQFPRMLLAFTYISSGQFPEAEDALEKVLIYSQQFGTEIIRTPAHTMMGIILISKGHLKRGFKMMEDAQREDLEKGRKYAFTIEGYAMGKLYQQISKGVPFSLSVFKNIGFIVKNLLFVGSKAEDLFKKTIEGAKEIGAKGLHGQACLDLALLYKSKGRIDEARDCLSEAIIILEQCEAETYLNNAKEAMELWNNV